MSGRERQMAYRLTVRLTCSGVNGDPGGKAGWVTAECGGGVEGRSLAIGVQSSIRGTSDVSPRSQNQEEVLEV